VHCVRKKPSQGKQLGSPQRSKAMFARDSSERISREDAIRDSFERHAPK
jgi:hypothetical protein